MSIKSKPVFFPINVQALCVADNGEQTFIPKEQDFKKLDDKDTAPLGENVMNSILNTPKPLNQGTGIHLHWALPDAISHIYQAENTRQGSVDKVIPKVPNRWLITRIHTPESSKGAIQSKSWIVESDYLEKSTSKTDATAALRTDIPYNLDDPKALHLSLIHI